MPDAKKPSKSTSKPRATSSKTAAKRPAKAPESKYLSAREESAEVAPVGEMEELEPSRPVAVAGSGMSGSLSSLTEEEADAASAFEKDLFALGQEPEVATDAAPAPSDGPPEVERPGAELIAGGIALLLAISTFLPWFTVQFTNDKVSGWAAGRFGPLVTFLGLAGVLIVLLRRFRKDVAFPVDHALVIEGIGWLTTLGIVLSNLFRPKVASFPTRSSIFLFVSLLLAVALALWAGRISSSAPFVIRPGWFKRAAGKLGAAILIVSLLAGVAFGVLNGGSNDLSAAPTKRNQPPAKILGEPPCLKTYKFPVPAGIKAEYGLPSNEPCIAVFFSELKAATVDSRLRAALTNAGWKYSRAKAVKGTSTGDFRQLSLTKPSCGTVVTLPDPNKKHKTQVVVSLASCPTAKKSPARN